MNRWIEAIFMAKIKFSKYKYHKYKKTMHHIKSYYTISFSIDT